MAKKKAKLPLAKSPGKRKLKWMYDRMGIVDIAAQQKTSPQTVRGWLEDLGIEIRGRGFKPPKRGELR